MWNIPPFAIAKSETDRLDPLGEPILNRTKPRNQAAAPSVRPSRNKRDMVEPDGIEPTTSCLQSTRSPS